MYFHVSKVYLGEEPTLTPKVPSSALPSEEGDIPRICVSTSVYHCLRAITSCSPLNARDLLFEFKKQNVPFETTEDIIVRQAKIIFPAVYSTKDQPHLPPNASDFRANKEYWFLHPTTFKFEGYVDLKWLVEKEKIRLVSTSGYLEPSYLQIGAVIIKKHWHIK